MTAYVPVIDPLEACVRLTVMLVIPAAGPGDTQVPDTSVLAGVVSSGPQDPSASAPSASSEPSGTRKMGINER